MPAPAENPVDSNPKDSESTGEDTLFIKEKKLNLSVRYWDVFIMILILLTQRF